MSIELDDSLISDFVAESREHLDTVEPDLLLLESSDGEASEEIINRIFRAIHSIKGGAGFLAYESLKVLSHTMESVLMLVRDGELTITPEIADVLLGGVDRLRAMVDDIEECENIPCQDAIDQFNQILENAGRAPVGGEADSATPLVKISLSELENVFDIDESRLKVCIKHGQHLFRVRAFIPGDLEEKGASLTDFIENIEALGECLDSTLNLDEIADLSNCLEKDGCFTFLFATVLDADLVASALNLGEDQVDVVELEQLDADDATPLPSPPEEAQAEEVPPDKEAQPEELTGDSEANSTTKPSGKGTSGGNAEVETLRVKVSLLSHLMNMAGELVLARNQLLRTLSDESDSVSCHSSILQNIDRVTTEIQEGIMQTRMQPVGTVFSRFPRLVRDTSRKLGKEIELTVTGSEVELDKSIIELLGDPLTHIIRNCADHAIETPEERESHGKDRQGTIKLTAYHEGGQVNISVSDDGRGIDVDAIVKKSIEKGLIDAEQAAKLNQRDRINLIFAAGISTAKVVSDVSGRGVGMDVVRSNIEKLGGTVNIESAVGEGTTVLLQLPLTLAIIPSLIVEVADQRFAVPQVNVDEFVWVRASEVRERIEYIQGQDVLRLRGMLLPLVSLRDLLGMEARFDDSTQPDHRVNIADRRSCGEKDVDDAVVETEGAKWTGERKRGERRKNWQSDYNIVVMKIGTNRFGVIVDRLHDTEEIVVKPLASFVKGCRCFSGATILGDGRVITILDALGIANLAELRFSDLEVEEKRRLEEEERRTALAQQARRSVILFTSSETEYFAVPQETVMRLERIDTRDIQVVENREFIEYRGHGLPIIRLDEYLPVGPLPDEMTEAFLIIPKSTGRSSGAEAAAGIMVSKIADAMDVEVDIDSAGLSGPGVLGSAMVQGQLTLFLDLAELMESTGVEGGVQS